ncbi:MAG: serine hydrolase [Woeseiaceae bacterium]
MRIPCRFQSIAALVAALSLQTNLAAEPVVMPEVAAGFEQLIERDNARAVAIGLYDNGISRFISMGRLSDIDLAPPMSDTVFEIGSISKVFTALLTQVQVDEGRLDWNTAIAEYLPEIEFANAQIAAIRLQELATHTSGLPRLPDNMQFEDPSDPYAGYGRDDLLAYLAAFDPESLEKSYAYSNLGAGLLGVIAAGASGKNYPTVMTTDVLNPLGLSNTHSGPRQDLVERLAVGFSSGADMSNWDGFDALAGAGALVSSVDDMVQFIEQSLDGEALGGAIRKIQASQGDGRTGLGWHLQQTDDNKTVVWHNGGTGGYASYVAIRPDNNTGVVILTTSTAYARVTELGLQQISGQVAPKPAVDLSPYLGAYRLDDNFVLTIFAEDGELFGQATGQGAFPLSYTSTDRFSFATASIEVTFSRDADERVNELTLLQAGTSTTAPRVDESLGVQRRAEIAIEAEVLRQYAGRYQLTPNAVISVESRNDQMYVTLTGQPSYPVFAFAPDKFFYRVVDAELHFEKDDDAQVVAVVLHQQGQQRAPRID